MNLQKLSDQSLRQLLKYRLQELPGKSTQRFIAGLLWTLTCRPDCLSLTNQLNWIDWKVQEKRQGANDTQCHGLTGFVDTDTTNPSSNNRPPKSPEILMFALKKISNNAVRPQSLAYSLCWLFTWLDEQTHFQISICSQALLLTYPTQSLIWLEMTICSSIAVNLGSCI